MHQPSLRHLGIHSWSSSTMLFQCQLTCTQRITPYITQIISTHTDGICWMNFGLKVESVLPPICRYCMCVWVVCAPVRSGRGCEGQGRRRGRGRGLWAAGRWSLRPAEGAVCSHWGSRNWAARLNSSAQSPAAPPSSGCLTTCQTDEEMKEYDTASVELRWLQNGLHRVSYTELYTVSLLVCFQLNLPILPEGSFSLRKPEGEENKDDFMKKGPEVSNIARCLCQKRHFGSVLQYDL